MALPEKYSSMSNFLQQAINKCKSHATTVAWLSALAVTAVLLLVSEYHVMWKIQEQNLFLDTPLFFRELMTAPGGLLMYVGSFLTQLLYYPVLGVAVLCGLWWLLMALMRRTFRVGEPWSLLLLVPVALLLSANVDMGYWLYPIKLKGWYFDATIGTLCVVLLLWAYRRLSAKRWARRLLIVVTTIIGYPLLGSYALAASLLMAFWSWRIDDRRGQAAVDTLLALFAVVAVPLICYRYVYYQTNIANMWWTALPTFKILEEYPTYYLPYALLGLCLLILTLGRWESKDVKGHKPTVKRQRVVVAVVLAGMVYGLWTAWMKDENFHREVHMQHLIEQTRWEDVLEVAAQQKDDPTRAVVLMRNLALTRLGRQSTEMYRYRNGSKQPASPFPMKMSMIAGSLIYYHYGMLNDSHHMCVESGVEYGWRPEHMKYMSRCALLTGEKNILYKFTSLLKHTLFHGEWAEHLERLEQSPELRQEDPEVGPILHLLHWPDMVGSDHGYTERYLMNHLAQMDSADPSFQEQCLLATLWTKTSRHFWPRFAAYLNQHQGQPIPRYYLEAAWLYTVNEGHAPFEVPIDENIKIIHQQFTNQLPRYDGMDIKEVRDMFRQQYGDTYFFEYYMMDDLDYQ